MTVAPHLPPPTCTIARHERWQRTKVVIVASLFGIFAGLTGAAVFAAWLWPGFTGNDALNVSATHGTVSADALLAQAEAQVDDKLYSIYSQGTAVGSATSLSANDRLATGVVVVSSGWLVAYLPNYGGHFSTWQIVGPDGTAYTATGVVFDKRSGFAFIKMSPIVAPAGLAAAEQFKVAVFAQLSDAPTPVFVYHADHWFETTYIGQHEDATDPAHLDTAPLTNYLLGQTFTPGDLVIDQHGNVLGFVTSGDTLTPAATVPSMLTNIDNKTVFTYPTLGVEGWYSSEAPVVAAGESMNGFLVVKIVGNTTLFKKGDILLEANGLPFTFSALWGTIQQGKVNVTLLRAGKTITEAVPVISL